ncbi:MAG: hypothetical protein IJH92_07750 [Mogibacterium sp.]|nr:hypothetical protein [Mogibacterium sp.]
MSRKDRTYAEKHMSTVLPEEKEHKRSAWKCWLVSLAVNALILAAVFYLTDLMYETNDDYSIAYKIATDYPYVGFVNYYLCKVLIAVQGLIPNVNAFMMSQIVTSFIAFTAVFRVLLERNDEVLEDVLAAAVIAFFSFDHYCILQFTKTSALLMAAGLLYVADAYTHRKNVLAYIGGFLLYFTGVCYRQMGMFPALSFVCLFMFFWWILNGREYFKGRRPLAECALVLVIVVLLVAPYGFDKLSDSKNASTPELALGRQYQALRIKVTDYPVLDNYDKFKDEYEAAGISENDIATIDRFVLDYDGAASLENLQTITRINSAASSGHLTVKKAVKKFVKKTLKELKERSFTGMHVIALAAMAVFMLLVIRPRSWIYVIMIGGLTVALYIAIYYMQRTKYRAFYVADISAAFWLLYVIASEGRKPGPERSGARKWMERILCVVMAAAVISFFPKEMRILAAKNAHNAETVETAEVTEYLENHPDSFYVVATSIQKYPAEYLDPLAVPTMPDNQTNTGGWETLTPARMEFLESHGIYNPVKDIIDRPDCYFFGRYKMDMLKEYYNKWYGGDGKTVVFEKADEIGSYEIFRLVTVDS